MGADGPGIFANDDAMDFIGDVAEEPETAGRALRKALRRGRRRLGYLDVTDGSAALAAAAIVSAARPGSPVDRGSPVIDEYLTEIAPHVPAGLEPLAVKAIDRVFAGRSELAELWGDEGLLDQVRAEPMAVREHLSR